MIKGGYQIIDLQGATITGTMKGFLTLIDNANNKPIILTNFKISTTLYSGNYFINYNTDGDSGYVLTLIISNTLYKIAISKAGVITLTSGSITVS